MRIHLRLQDEEADIDNDDDSVVDENILGSGDDDGDDLLGSGVFTESRFELSTQALGRD